MKTVIVDYSDTGVVTEKYTGKFVQIRHEDIEFLIFSPKELTKYHADLVELFCLKNGLHGTYDSEHKRFDIHDPGWVIVGGGKFEWDRTGKQIRLYDNSMAYGKFNAEGLKERIKGELSDYMVQIE